MILRPSYLILLFLANAHAEDAQAVKESGTDEGKIIGGTDVPFGKYPWFAKARNGNNWGGCGGMLVAPEWVLTAAHCVTGGGFPAFEIGAICHDENNYSANGNCGQPSQVISTVKTISHPNYNGNTEDNDFALAKLSTAATANYVNMDLNGIVNSYNSNSPVWAIGFGNQNPNASGYYPGRLQHVEVFYVPQNTCNTAYGGGITSNMFCAADSGQDSCQGDSGGPLYDANNNVLVGVVSWGYNCASPGYPGVYSKVYAQRDWIKNTICSDSNPRPSFCDGGTPLPTATVTSSPTRAPVTTGPTAQCFNIPDWKDSYGDGCSWYESAGATGCATYGNDVGTGGLTANQACCVCGGGTSNPSPATPAPTRAPVTSPPTRKPVTSSPTRAPVSGPTTGECFNIVPNWKDTYGDGCSWYESAGADGCTNWGNTLGTAGYTANQACCTCGGGTSTLPPPCTDSPGWADSAGDGCAWYAATYSRCLSFGDDYAGTYGQTANQACCACGGGTVGDTRAPTKTVTSAPTKTPTKTVTSAPNKTPTITQTSAPTKSPTKTITSAPTKAPTSNNCSDDDNFFFILNNGNFRTCSWLTQRPDKIEFRVGTYCAQGHVKGACQKTCNSCPCEDEPGFKFFLLNGNLRGCSWLTNNENRIDQRRDSYCYSDFFGSASYVGDACVSSCGFCLSP